MLSHKEIEKISNKINEMIENTPMTDLKHNLYALIRGVFTKMELVSREEFDIQTEVLHKTRDKLQALEIKLAELESKNSTK